MPNFGYEDFSMYPWDLCWEIHGLIELATGAMEYAVLCPVSEECSRGPAIRKTIYTGFDPETQ